MVEAEGRPERTFQQEQRRPAAANQAAPAAPLANPFLAMQQTAGNQTVQRMVRSGVIPPHLILGQQQTLGNQAVQRLLADRGQPAPAAGGSGDDSERVAAQAVDQPPVGAETLRGVDEAHGLSQVHRAELPSRGQGVMVQRKLDEDFPAAGTDAANEKPACKAFAQQVSGYVDQAHLELMSGHVKGWKGAKIASFLKLLNRDHSSALVHVGNAIEERVYALMQGNMKLKWTPQYSERMGGSSFPDIVINLASGKEALIDITSQRGHILGKAGAWTTSNQYIYVAEAYFPSVYKEHLPGIKNAIKAGGMSEADVKKMAEEVEKARLEKAESIAKENAEAREIYWSYGNFTRLVDEAFDGDRTEAARWMREHGMGTYRGVPKKTRRKSISLEQRAAKRKKAAKEMMNKMTEDEKKAWRLRQLEQRAAAKQKKARQKAVAEKRTL